MAWKWYDSKLIKVLDESPTTKRFWLEVESEDVLDFKAGQFITMDLPIHDKRLKRWRSYSIANHPDGSNVLEVCIVLLEGGLGSTYLFNEIKIGDNIKFKGPDGGFCLPEKIEKDLVFVCTGTGVAPFRSMLWDIYHQKKAHKNIHLIFGTRNKSGVLYEAEWKDLMTKLPGFSYSVALSREDVLPENNGIAWHKGYVHPVYAQAYKAVRKDVDFYLCGWTKMIDEAVAKLIVDLGYDKAQVHYELYG